MYSNKVRNIELPENLFSNLGELKSKKLEKKEPVSEIIFDEPINNYHHDTEIKLTNYSNRKEYRNRIDKMYKDINEIIPIDNEIDNILYFNNYIEKGIVVKPKVSSLKQFWTEYRLINNEKLNEKQQIPVENDIKTLDDFDELFETLSQRVSEINKYIDELREMKKNIDESSMQLEKDKENLSNERQKFLDYKKDEEKKLKEEKAHLKINFDRLQTIIDDLDKRLESIDTTKYDE